MNPIKVAAKRAAKTCANHASDICVVAGVVCLLGTTVLAVRAHDKAKAHSHMNEEVLNDIENEINFYQDNPEMLKKLKHERMQERRALLWLYTKDYAFATLSAVAGGALIFKGYGMVKADLRDATLAATSIAAGFVEYRKRVANVIGDEAEQRIANGMHVEKTKVVVQDENGNQKLETKEIMTDVDTPNPFGFVLDKKHCCDWSDDDDINRFMISSCLREAEIELQAWDHNVIFINDILRRLGSKKLPITGQLVGYKKDNGHIKYAFTDVDAVYADTNVLISPIFNQTDVANKRLPRITGYYIEFKPNEVYKGVLEPSDAERLG